MLSIFVLNIISCDRVDSEPYFSMEEDINLSLDLEEIPDIVGENFRLLMDIAKSQNENKKAGEEINSNQVLATFEDICSEKQLLVAKREWCNTTARATEVSSSVDIMPDTIGDYLFEGFMDPCYDCLLDVVEKIKNSEWYLQQPESIKREISVDLLSIAEIRDVIIESESLFMSRMSPGDRMIWSETVSQMDDQSRKTLFQAVVSGIAFVTPSVVSVILTFVTFI